MITVEGVVLTPKIIALLKSWQQDECHLDGDIQAIDDAITYIACEHECPLMDSDKEALNIIACLSFVKRNLRLFAAK